MYVDMHTLMNFWWFSCASLHEAGLAPAIREVMTRETKTNVKLSVVTGRKEKAPRVDFCFKRCMLFCMPPGFSTMRSNYLQRSQNLLKILLKVQCTFIDVGLLLSLKLVLLLLPSFCIEHRLGWD